VLRRRAGAAVRAEEGRAAAGPARTQGQLRRRHGPGPVHAVELPAVGEGRRRRRPPRPAHHPAGRVRLDRQLLRDPRLGARRRRGRARHARRGCGGLQARKLGPGPPAGRPGRARLSAAAGRAGGRRRHPAHPAGRCRARVLDRLPQLLRDHPLQPFADVLAVGAPAVAGDPRRGRAGAMRRLLPLLAVLLLAGCAGTAKKPSSPGDGRTVAPATAQAPDCTGFRPYPPAQEDPSTRGNYVAGGLYRPGVSDTTPDYVPNVACIAEPAVVHEPRSAYGNRSPYKVLGKSYRVLDSSEDFVETGLASYYGNKFHGRRTSNQEIYDMYAFTAAHKSLPLPSFARVTNLENGRSVVVRVNDRGPFHEGRVIDLSYAAAVRLDIHRRG